MCLLYIHLCIYHHVYIRPVHGKLSSVISAPASPQNPFSVLGDTWELLNDSSSTQNHQLLTKHINCLVLLGSAYKSLQSGILDAIFVFVCLFCFGAFWSSYHLSFAVLLYFCKFKGMFHPNMNILSSSTHPNVVSNLCDLLSFKEYKRRGLDKCSCCTFPCSEGIKRSGS